MLSMRNALPLAVLATTFTWGAATAAENKSPAQKEAENHLAEISSGKLPRAFLTGVVNLVPVEPGQNVPVDLGTLTANGKQYTLRTVIPEYYKTLKGVDKQTVALSGCVKQKADGGEIFYVEMFNADAGPGKPVIGRGKL